MAIRTQWDNDKKTVLRQTIEDQWTLEDLHAAMQTRRSMLTSQKRTVHIISHIEGNLCMPKGFMGELKNLAGSCPANAGVHVVVGGGAYVKGVYNTAKYLAPRLTENIRFASTLDEARVIIAEVPVEKRTASWVTIWEKATEILRLPKKPKLLERL